MTEVYKTYNTLPTLGKADEMFTNREPMFEAVSALLAQWNHEFGLCLVHSHCKLVEGEIMLAKGNASKPETIEDCGDYFPERWLSNGAAYEFTIKPTQEPPKALIDEFNRIVQQTGVLGLYYTGPAADAGAGAQIEWTEGRANLTRPLTEADKANNPVQTGWNFGRGDPLMEACEIFCDTRTTRSGSGNVHKNTQTHK